jgi:hypothetical protein
MHVLASLLSQQGWQAPWLLGAAKNGPLGYTTNSRLIFCESLDVFRQFFDLLGLLDDGEG